MGRQIVHENKFGIIKYETKSNVNFTLEQAMKAQRKNGGKALLFL
jgi:hypothetical protein